MLIDQSSFSKYEIAGPGAFAALQRLAANDLDKPAGALVYTQLCNERGGIEADLTFVRLDENRFYMVTGSGLRRARHRLDPASTCRPTARSRVQDLTSARATINLAGPLSRRILEKVADGDVSNEAFPYMTAREPAHRLRPRAGAPRHLSRRTGLGAAPADRICRPCLRAALRPPAGNSAWPTPATAPSIRCAWRSAISTGAPTSRPTTRPTRRAWASPCRSGRRADFIGRAALEKAKADGPKRKLITLLVDAAVQLYGGEAIRRDGKVLGVTSSAGWGHTIGKAVAFGYVAAEEAGHADYEIEAFTQRHAATRIAGAAVDPERKKILA